MNHEIVCINFDRSVYLRYITNYLNGILFKFVFYQGTQLLDVRFISFIFIIYEPANNIELLKIDNTMWTKNVPNELEYFIASLNIKPGNYKIDFTGTYPQGTVSTIAKGEFIIKNRNIKNA